MNRTWKPANPDHRVLTANIFRIHPHGQKTAATRNTNPLNSYADWLNSWATAFLPDDAQWMAGPEGSSAAIELSDFPALAAMKLAAERQKDILDLRHISNTMYLEDQEQLVQLAYAKYGED